MGLPSKPEEIAGGEVERYVREGRIEEVANHCETDVVNTYQIWLRVSVEVSYYGGFSVCGGHRLRLRRENNAFTIIGREMAWIY